MNRLYLIKHPFIYRKIVGMSGMYPPPTAMDYTVIIVISITFEIGETLKQVTPV